MKLVGTKVHRVEDDRILTGRGRYLDDVQLPRLLHAAFLRSPLAHARILSIDVSAARQAPGVAGVFTGEDAVALTTALEPALQMAEMRTPLMHALATDKVRLVGDLVALVVAENRYLAEDACELIDVEYEPLPAVTSAEASLDPDSPRLFEDLEDNVMFRMGEGIHWGDINGAFADADRVIRETFRQHRRANVPMETRGGVADFDPATGNLTCHAMTQALHQYRMQMAKVLRHPLDRIHVLIGDVGGSFGLKAYVPREEIAIAMASKQLGRPVKWIEDRNEHLLASGHAREETVEVEAAVKDDGTVLGLRARLVMDQGAYPVFPYPSSLMVNLINTLLPGPYRLRGYQFEAVVAATNKASHVAYRGPWAVETWVRERLLDVIAAELGIDAAEIRRKNMVLGEPEDRLVTFPSLAGVSSRQSLDKALELGDYTAFRAEQEVARAEGRHLGIGFATFIEMAPGPPEVLPPSEVFGSEPARARLEADGHLVVYTQQSPSGQGHETTLAQIAADELGIPFAHVRVVTGDSRLTPFSILGTGDSRAATWASGAVMHATRAVKEKVLAVAAAKLGADAESLEITDGVITAAGDPETSITLAQIASDALLSPEMLPAGADLSFEASVKYRREGVTGSGWSGGTHLCVVEVDLGTGAVRILRYLVVEDCGRIINPAIVDGQIRGGIAQGIGGVLYEHAAYDDEGQCLTGTFVDYLLPTTMEIPPVEIHHLETGLQGEVDFRGVGEGGAIVAPAALTNAIADALAPFGARVTEQFLPPERILELAGLVTT